MYGLTQFPGFYGIVVGVAMFFVVWSIAWLCLKNGPFHMDFLYEKGSFLPLFAIYADIVKFVLGLASGSIALLVGSAVFRSTGATGTAGAIGAAGPLLAPFASPLWLLALSLIGGVLFMTFLALDYEAERHHTKPYTRGKYSRNLALGFTGLFCFAVGYSWLIYIVMPHR